MLLKLHASLGVAAGRVEKIFFLKNMFFVLRMCKGQNWKMKKMFLVFYVNTLKSIPLIVEHR